MPGNPNLFHVLYNEPDTSSIRESFFVSMLKSKHSLKYAKSGDYAVDERFVFEIGGKNKKAKQIKDTENAFLVVDNVEIGVKNKIPLWLFGFLY